ncbi:glycosyltransferase [Amycolatopsis nigrescens]|uniref:glycosyltransferase n=1 Tax=Amycolatopsis nigrescens TaxID=381445 RepID=UPI000475E64F|nr:glycosyltransferase [Amycolatopsis nigrescens]
MRILFSSLPGHGHTYPLLPLAIAARAAGHDIMFATGAEFHPTLRDLGFEAIAAGKSFEEARLEVMGQADRADSLEGEELQRALLEIFGVLLPRSFAVDLRPVLAERKPDLVVAEVGNPGAGLAAIDAGIPVVRHGFGREMTAEFGELVGAGLRRCAAELGIALADGDLGPGAPTLDICPPSFQEPETVGAPNRMPLRPVPFNPPGELPAGVRRDERDRPLVYLTLGTAFGVAEVLRAAIAGLATLDVDVLVAAGPSLQGAALGTMPPGVRVESWVPQGELLPHADLVVHHGGSGTTLGSFGVGVPQLFLPQGADQFENAAAVVAAGAGDQLVGAEQTAEAVAAKAKRLLTDEPVLAAARRFADEVAAMPTPAEVAEQLPALAAS